MRKEIKDSLKMILTDFMIITVVLLISMGFIKLLSSSKSDFDWYFPFQIIGIAASTSILSLVFLSFHEQTKKEFIIRCIIHFILLVGVVLLEGYLFSWWNELKEMFIVLIILIIIYVIVWMCSIFLDKKTSDNINKALKNIKNKDE